MSAPLGHTQQRRALDIFDAVLEASLPQRAALLTRLCEGDAALEARVRELLAADAGDDGILAALPVLSEEDAITPDPWLGRAVGPWLPVRLLGRGGMGAVYLAQRQGDFDQRAALKLIRLELDSPESRQRFMQERRILAGLRHPGIATLLDGGVSAQGVPYFAMEYIDGARIDHWCDARKLGIRARVELFLRALDAVQHAHRNLLVHRDLKPANVLVDADGHPKLLDFGIAKLLEDEGEATRTRERALTPEFAAPEQLRGEAITTATDIYQLGLMLHALLSGSHAFGITAETPLARQWKALQGAPQTLTQGAAQASAQTLSARDCNHAQLLAQLRGDLSAIVSHCLSPQPEQRYASVDALGTDLRRWLRGLPVSVRAHSHGYRLRAFLRRNRLAVGATAAVMLSLAVGMGAAFWQARLAQQQAAVARGERDRAIAEAARSDAVRTYLQLMFRDGTSANGQINPRDVLQHAAGNIAKRFATDPDAGRATALALAQMALGLGDAEAADPLITQALQWPRAQPNPEIEALAWQARAQADLFKGDVPAGLAAHARADALWRANPARFAAVRNEGQGVLGALQRKGGTLDASIVTLRAAVAERREQMKLADLELVNLLGELCNSEASAGQLGPATTDCRSALALAERLGNADSTSALATRNALAVTLVKQQRLDEAASEFQQLLDRHGALYGHDSPDGAAIELNLASVLGKLGRTAAALQHARHAADVVASPGTAPSPSALSAHLLLGDLSLQQGDAAVARHELQVASAMLERLPPLQPVFRGKLARSQAKLAMAEGQTAAAKRWLDSAETAFRALGAPAQADVQSIAALRQRWQMQ